MNEEPFEILGPDRPGRWLVSCDHASNHVPHWVNDGDLGLPPEDMNRHIAYDIGAAGVTRHLSKLLDSPAILSHFSRLVIDPNRGEDDPTLMMRLYDGTIIPGNRNADQAEKDARIRQLYRPYHAAYADLANKIADPVICAIHSFTPRLRGRTPRPWEVGVLYADDTRFALPFLQACRAAGWCTGDNQPYAGHLPGDAVDRHALQHGRPNVLIELRHDLIADDAGQALWAARLAPILNKVLTESGL
ncbi:N-formylglutamate amidohydrolase [Loktanella agnita]|uniref:N-formylglutamate amidohydrolase n=1 Tax=Loktanella agnita TaxID=287097 RepID=UPI003988429E